MITQIKRAFRELCKQNGQDMVEYALIMGLVSVVAVSAVIALGGSIGAFWQTLSTSIPAI